MHLWSPGAEFGLLIHLMQFTAECSYMMFLVIDESWSYIWNDNLRPKKILSILLQTP